jgi:hypothetical protein
MEFWRKVEKERERREQQNEGIIFQIVYLSGFLNA